MLYEVITRRQQGVCQRETIGDHAGPQRIGAVHVAVIDLDSSLQQFVDDALVALPTGGNQGSIVVS